MGASNTLLQNLMVVSNTILQNLVEASNTLLQNLVVVSNTLQQNLVEASTDLSRCDTQRQLCHFRILVLFTSHDSPQTADYSGYMILRKGLLSAVTMHFGFYGILMLGLRPLTMTVAVKINSDYG